MLQIKYYLLIFFLSLSYQDDYCIDVFKKCNIYYNPTVEHCILGAGNMCLECEENYSPSNDKTRCINFGNCNYFDEEDKCLQCSQYYNFNANKQCVPDACVTYDSDGKTCLNCNFAFYLKDGVCQRIPIPYCSEGNEKSCTSCLGGTKLENGKCILPTFVEGCEEYNSDRTCKRCKEEYNLNNGKCDFKNNCGEIPVINACTLCDDAHYVVPQILQCYGYDGSRGKRGGDNEAGLIKNKYAFMLLLFILLC